MHHIYILQSQKDLSFYIGYSSDVQDRLSKHNNSKSGYTSTKKPWNLVYTESFHTKTEALKREKFLKAQKSKKFIESLIQAAAG